MVKGSLILWVAIGLGGAGGAVLRALVSQWIRTDWPWATLLVNVGGSLLIGLLYGLEAALPDRLPMALRQALTVGFCGALTTFSTFSYQTLALLHQGQTSGAMANVLLSLTSCLLAVWLGMRLAQALVG